MGSPNSGVGDAEAFADCWRMLTLADAAEGKGMKHRREHSWFSVLALAGQWHPQCDLHTVGRLPLATSLVTTGDSAVVTRVRLCESCEWGP